MTLVAAGALSAQRSDTSSAASGSVSGLVFDSLGGRPLAMAVVQLVNADSVSAGARTTVSDSSGRYRFDGVRSGRYVVGFLHPLLDSLGIEPTLHDVSHDGQSAVRTDLSIPSALSLRASICGARAVADSDALIVGTVRTAAEQLSVDSAIVTAQWVEVLLDRGRVQRNVVRRQTRTLATGWFAICGAPMRGTIALGGAHGADSTIVLELDVPPSGFLRRDLYFGAAVPVPADSSGTRGVVGATRNVRGDGRLSGIVVREVGGKPLVGARVRIVDGPQTLTDDRGMWTLTGIPTGTRMLEVRAVAQYPVTMPVDVVDGAAPIRVGMVTLESVLETVRVTAKQNGGGNLLEFLSHRRTSGFGRFLTREDIDNQNAAYASEIFRTVAGIVTETDLHGRVNISMRGTLAARCQPTFYLNGNILRNFTAGDLDDFIRPNDLVGVEIYTGVLTPAQFSDFGSCGSIALWTR